MKTLGAVVLTALLFGGVILAQATPARSRSSMPPGVRTATTPLSISSGVVSIAAAPTFTGLVTGLQFSSTKSSGSASFSMNDGALLNFSAGDSSAYMRRSATDTIEVAGKLSVVGAVIAGSALNKGAVTLSGGTGTATVTSGAVCVCSLNTSAGTAAPKCSVTSTTLTVTGSGTDVINYHCF